MANFGQLFTGAPNRVEQVPRFGQEQMSAMQNLLQMGQQGLQNPYQGFEPIAQQARSQFAQQTVPSIAERFTSLGGNRGQNALSSPAFASQLGQSGAGLEEALAALQSQYGLQNRSQFAQLLGMGLQPQYENMPMGGESGLLQGILPTLGRATSHAGAGLLSGGFPGLKSALSALLSMI